MRVRTVICVMAVLAPFAAQTGLAGTGTAARGTRRSVAEAARAGDSNALRALLRTPGAVNMPGVDGSTALHWAVERDDRSMVETLLAAGANARAVNRYGVTPLTAACINGDAAVVERLIKAGADPDETLPDGETALMTASRTGSPDVLRVLLARGAKVNARESQRGQTALMWAAANNNAEAIRVLVEAGAEVRAKATGPQMTRAATVTRGRTVLPPKRMDAVDALMFAVRRGHMDAVRALLDLGADVNDTMPDKTSALVVAIANAHWALAGYLLDRGADPNASAQGWAPLHQVARTRRGLDEGRYPWPVSTGALSPLDLVKKLVERGANVNARATKKINDVVRNSFGVGATPFALAAKAVDHELMRLLLAFGADPTIRTATGTTPLMAVSGVEMFNPGEDTHSDDDAMVAARLLLELGADVNAKNRMGESALLGAAARGYNPLVRLLAEHGASFDVEDVYGWTPLLTAEFGKNYGGAQIKNPETAKLLRSLMTERGVSIDRPSDAELFERLFGPCGHGVSVKAAPPGKTLADRCEAGQDLLLMRNGSAVEPPDKSDSAPPGR